MSAAGFTWAAAAEYSSLSVSSLRRWARRGVLQVSRVGGRVIVFRDSLEALMRGEVAESGAVTPVGAYGSLAGSMPDHTVLTRRRRRGR